MKILAINQHSKNHGDQAAAYAVYRSLYDQGYTDLTIGYMAYEPWTDDCNINYKDIKSLPPTFFSNIKEKVVRFALKHDNKLLIGLTLLFPSLLSEFRSIKSADFVIVSPGGPNLGKYIDYRYLWRVYVTNMLGKKYAFYSPSIGPFPTKDLIFDKQAIKVLKNASFISLRDAVSYECAKRLGLNYVKSIDSAFLESPETNLPPEIKAVLPEQYVVIVPNQLYKWHGEYYPLKKEFDIMYERIIDFFVKKGVNIVLLPQIYDNPKLDDEAYFTQLASQKKNVIVIPTKYHSDIQQMVIKGAQYVVGARYHTIVFSINNKTPFCCLAYEHKMTGMLSLLGLTEYGMDIRKCLNNKMIGNDIYDYYQRKNEMKAKLTDANLKAKNIARSCFFEFINILKP